MLCKLRQDVIMFYQWLLIILSMILFRLSSSINQSIKFYLYSPYSQTTVRLIGLSEHNVYTSVSYSDYCLNLVDTRILYPWKKTHRDVSSNIQMSVCVCVGGGGSVHDGSLLEELYINYHALNTITNKHCVVTVWWKLACETCDWNKTGRDDVADSRDELLSEINGNRCSHP